MKTRSLFLILAGAAAFLRSPLLAREVTSYASDGPGSLRQAILDAAAGETITFHQSLIGKTIILDPLQQLVINKNLTILGPGPDKLVISANHVGRAIYVGAEVTLAGLTITDGLEGSDGGGIYNAGRLTLRNCNVTGNSSLHRGGGIVNLGLGRPVSLTLIDSTISGNSCEDGGGIYNGAGDWNASLWVETSTISSNSAMHGGGIANAGLGLNPQASLVVSMSTLSGNSSKVGSAIFNGGDVGNGSALIVNSTISGNYSPPGVFNENGAFVNQKNNGRSAVMWVGNTTFSDNLGNIIANNLGAELQIGSTILNVSRAAFTNAVSIRNYYHSKVSSLGYNLASDGGVLNRSVSTGALNEIGDQLNTDPLLGPLKDNGGPTFTHAPFCASPAIDRGLNVLHALSDQCGFVRSVVITGSSAADGTDIGAFEAQQTPPCDRPPVALCKNVEVSAGPNCMAYASLDNGSFDPDPGDRITLSQSPPGPYTRGKTSVTLTVTDQQGASASSVATVNVVDKTPPTINTRDITVALGANGTATIYPDQVVASVSDNCGNVMVYSVWPNSFTCANVGANNVILTAGDSLLNYCTAVATVTIVDNTPPTIATRDITVALGAGGTATVLPDQVFASGSDNCGAVNLVSVTPSSFTWANIGTNSVTLKAQDEHGNIATAVARVIVVDNRGAGEQIGDLMAKVNTLTELKDVTRHHLLVKLELALKAFNSGQTENACHEMTEFIHATNDQKEKQLVPASIADDLIGNAAHIKIVLGCP